jgi:hypothetical protein
LVGRQLATAEKPYSQFQASSTTSRLGLDLLGVSSRYTLGPSGLRGWRRPAKEGDTRNKKAQKESRPRGREKAHRNKQPAQAQPMPFAFHSSRPGRTRENTEATGMCVRQGEASSKLTQVNTLSKKYKGLYTFLKEIHEKFETDTNKILFYHGACVHRGKPMWLRPWHPVPSYELADQSYYLYLININLRRKMFLLIYFFYVSYSILADHSPVQWSSICNGVKA